MENRIRPTRAGLFFIELMIAVGVFVFCAAVCIGLFTSAESMSRSDTDLVQAMSVARDAGECFKAAHGDLEQAAGLTGGQVQDGALSLYYDENWQRIEPGQAEEAVFCLSLQPSQAEGYAAADLRVWLREEQETPILAWQIAALEA